MLKDIKNILFNEIKEEIEQYEAAKNRINTINLRIEEIESITGWGFKTRDDIMRLEPPNKPSMVIKKFSFWDKWIFNRKQYLLVEKLNKEAQEKYNKEMEEYNKKCDEYSKEYYLLKEERNLLKLQCKDIEERGIRDKFEKIKNGKTLKEIDISFEEAVKLLEDKGIQLVLDESDKEITNNQSEFDKTEDFIFVHKTKYVPSNDEVKSPKYAGAKQKNTVYFDGEEFSYEFLRERNTVHLCQNGEVSSHVDGNFDGRKYAVLIPFVNVKDSKRLSSFSPQDTFFEEKVDIIDGYILCPIEEVESIQKLNPNSKVIGFEGESVDGFADSFLSMLGYRRESIGMHSWQNDADMKKHSMFVEKHSNLNYKWHAGSKEAFRDDFVEKFNKLIGFTESVIKNKNSGKKYNANQLTRALSNNDMRGVYESGIEKVETSSSFGAIGPSYSNMIRAYYYSYVKEEMYIGDFIEDNEFKCNSDSTKSNNAQFLFHILESRFNIKMPQNIKKILMLDLAQGEYPQDPEVISNFIETIQDEETKTFIDEMRKNGEIKSVDKVKDILFIKTIIDEAYKNRVLVQEKDNDTDEQEL